MKSVTSYKRHLCSYLSRSKRKKIVPLRNSEKTKNKTLEELKKEIKEACQGYHQALCPNVFFYTKQKTLFRKLDDYLSLKIPGRMAGWKGIMDKLLSNKGFVRQEVKPAAKKTLKDSIINIKTDTGSFEESVIDLYQALYILK